jgi:type II secretory pathway predicted ATPase ExeA
MNYTAHWGLSALPFENTPDPRFLYQSAQHEEGLARLRYVVEGAKGAAVLTGVFGCGKTLLARSLLSSLSSSRYRMAYLANPMMSEVELLHGIAHKLNVPDLPPRRSDVLVDALLDGIEHALRENQRDGKQTLVIVDEAHVIREERVFDELRLLLNFQDDDRFLLTLILMGQPELKEIIDRHKPLAQRICMGYHLIAFTETETGGYLQHRLQVAGASRTLFDPGAVQAVQELSGGIPRRINQIADLALLTGMGRQASHIDAAIVQEAAASVGV